MKHTLKAIIIFIAGCLNPTITVCLNVEQPICISKKVAEEVDNQAQYNYGILASVLKIAPDAISQPDNLMKTIIARQCIGPLAQISSIILDKFYILLINSNILASFIAYLLPIMAQKLYFMIIICLYFPVTVIIIYAVFNTLYQMFLYFYEKAKIRFNIQFSVFDIALPFEYIVFNMFTLFILIYLKNVIVNPLLITLSIAAYTIIKHLFRCIHCVCNGHKILNNYSYSHQIEFFLIDIAFLWPITFYNILFGTSFQSFVLYLFLTILFFGYLYYYEKNNFESLESILIDIQRCLSVYFFYNSKQFYRP